MPYLLRMLSGPGAKMRDGVGFKSPMKLVTQDGYTVFEHLPKGLTVNGGPDVEVKVAASEGEAKHLIAANSKHLEAAAASRKAYAEKVQAKLAAIREAAAKKKAEQQADAAPKTKQPARLSQQSHGGKSAATPSTTKTE